MRTSMLNVTQLPETSIIIEHPGIINEVAQDTRGRHSPYTWMFVADVSLYTYLLPETKNIN